MKLESIQFKHIALFHDLKIQFQYDKQPITLILGEQATGKSMLLKHIYHALTWFPARLKDARTPGIVMPDQDISHSRLQSKIEVSIQIPPEFGQLPETTSTQQTDTSLCSWKLFKTLNSSGVGISQVETQQLDQTITLYHQVTRKDPLQGLPLLAYYPSERFVNDINLLNKNLRVLPSLFLLMTLASFRLPLSPAFLSGYVKLVILKMRKRLMLCSELFRNNPIHKIRKKFYVSYNLNWQDILNSFLHLICTH